MKSPLRLAREQRGMTLQALGKLVESDVGNLSRIERGAQVPSRKLAERICAQFEGELSELQLIYPSRSHFGSSEDLNTSPTETKEAP